MRREDCSAGREKNHGVSAPCNYPVTVGSVHGEIVILLLRRIYGIALLKIARPRDSGSLLSPVLNSWPQSWLRNYWTPTSPVQDDAL